MRPIPMILTGLLAAALALPAVAQEASTLVPPSPATPTTVPEEDVVDLPAPAPGTHALTAADLEAWLDGFMPYAIGRGAIPGAVVVVVKDGEILLQKGYGYANVEEREPVDPATTLFRPGSVSKLFTWTAVMQLVEQGKLDLDADINQYLDFEIPAREGKPITLRQAMTHTTGMEEHVRGLIAAAPTPEIPLDKYLKRWVPTRIFGPGTTPAYSNYATSLAGYVVQLVSGQPFNDYIEEHIFEPLDMTYASFDQPLPESLQPFMSGGYEPGSDEAKPFEIVNSAPAGALSASGQAMGKFMIAHLQDGRYGDNRILQADTAQRMHTTALDMGLPLNRMLLGFYESNINGHRAIAHAGDTQWFHSDLNLFIDDGIGLFVSMNSSGRNGVAGKLRSALFKGFANRYLPGPEAEGSVDEETARLHAQQMAGVYENSRRSQSGFIALAGLLSQVKVEATEDGSITVPSLTGLDGFPTEWRQIGPYVWRDADGGDRLAADVVDGEVRRFSIDPFSAFMVFEPVPWWKSSAWLLPALVIGMGALLLTVLAWPVSALVRRYYGIRYKLTGRDAQMHRAVRIAALAVLVSMGAAFAMVIAMLTSLELLSPSNDWIVITLRVLALIVLPLGTLVAMANAWFVLRSRRRWTAKLWAIVIALSCLAVLWVGVVFSLLGFSANY